MTDANEILGLMNDEAEAAVPASMPTISFNLSLTDEDLDSGQSTTYVPIPAGTRTDFEVYSLEQQPWTNKHGEATVRWSMILRTTEDTWGVNKQVRHSLRFQPVESFNWGPFLKAVGLAQGGGDIDMSIFKDPAALVEGKKVSAKVLGYTWKDMQGNYQRSHGKENVRKPVPVDGTRYFEELGYFEEAKGLRSDEGDDFADAQADATFSEGEYM